MNMPDFIYQANYYGRNGKPFIFVIDYEKQQPQIFELDQAEQNQIYYQLKNKTNYEKTQPITSTCDFEIFPIAFDQYHLAFEVVQQQIQAGNSYLLNLTFPTRISTELSLKALFLQSYADYKLYFQDEFIVFSPECFIKTHNNQIYSYPMKGTIDATIPNAETLIMQNKKEEREHNTIVDLIRNDLAMVSQKIEVTRFRSLSKIHTNKVNLLQASSEIRGDLAQDWQAQIGDMLNALLPAGSISGAPKRKTLEIIEDVEIDSRGFYTGVFGIFDGKNVDSAVNIRFIEKRADGLYFRSGGGITALSEPTDEYQELINKIYVPTV